jgi:hypothetical protein
MSQEVSEDVPRALASNPNSPVSLLLGGLAASYPDLVAQNPVWEMLLLENPDIARSVAPGELQELEGLAIRFPDFARAVYGDVAKLYRVTNNDPNQWEIPWDRASRYSRRIPTEVVIYSSGWVRTNNGRTIGFDFYPSLKAFAAERLISMRAMSQYWHESPLPVISGRQLPARVGAGDPLIVQCVLVEKRLVPTLDKARALVERMRFSSSYMTESKDYWRFQQQSPTLFRQNSYVTKPLVSGVKVLMASHRPEVVKNRQVAKRKLTVAGKDPVGAFALTIPSEYGFNFDVFKNPTQKEISKEFPRGVARGLLMGPDAYFWAAGVAVHNSVSRELSRSRWETPLRVIFYFRPGQVSIIYEDKVGRTIPEIRQLLQEHPYVIKLMRSSKVRLRTGEGETDWADLSDKVGARSGVVGAGVPQDSLDDMMEADVASLTPEARRRFNIDCATLLLPLFEVKYPKEKRPQKAIEAARSFVNHKLSKEVMTEAMEASWEVIVDFFDRFRANDPRIQTDPEFHLIEDEAFDAAQAACAASSPDPDARAWTWVASAFRALEFKKLGSSLQTEKAVEKARTTGWRAGRARARKLLLKYL